MNPDFAGSQPTFILVTTVKVLGFLILVLYLLFSLVVVRQVQIMTRVLTTKISRQLKWLAIGHAFLAIIAFLTLLIAL